MNAYDEAMTGLKDIEKEIRMMKQELLWKKLEYMQMARLINIKYGTDIEEEI